MASVEGLEGQAERRRSDRARCRIPVNVALGKQKLRGLVRNLSEEGLCIILDEAVDPQQGETLHFVVAKQGAPKESISALVWHASHCANPRTGSGVTRLGLVLSNPSPLFEALVKRFAPPVKETSTLRRHSAVVQNAVAPESAELCDASYEVRVRGTQGPHIYTFAVKAASALEAREKFSGGIWQVVGVFDAAGLQSA